VHIVLVVGLLFCAVRSTLPAGASREGSPRHFVLVHGAWHGAWVWYRVRALLEAEGHTVTVLDLPSHGIDRTPAKGITLADYVNAVVAVVDAAAEPVVLVGHSMAGVGISSVAGGRPQEGAGLLCLAAYLVPSGKSLLNYSALDPDSLVLRHLVAGDGVLGIDPSGLAETFYGTSPAADVSLARTLIVPNSVLPLVTPMALTDACSGSVRRFCVRTAHDHAGTPSMQDRMISGLTCERVVTIDSDHSPFFSRPLALVRALERLSAR